MPAMTTYFSRSSGRTLSWKEAWGRDVPYALSVVVPCDAGKTLLGHGIGMSLSGAICMANDGQTFDSILKYFYNGIELKRVW
jgi:peptidoglycan hydrolase-like amidase